MTSVDVQQFGPWAVVTGASAGIGREFARQLAASGFHLVLVARRPVVLEALGTDLTARYGVACRTVALDLAEPASVEALRAATEDLEVGLLVSNAGAGAPGRFLDVPESVHLDLLQLNAATYLRLAHHYGRAMAARGRGGIVLVGAMGARDGIPYMAGPGATKAFVQSLGAALHHELAPSGVRTTVVVPGPTDTRVIDHFGLDRSGLPMQPMPVEQCVDEGLRALQAGRAVHLTGRINRVLLGLLPAALVRRANAHLLSSGLADGRPRLDHLASAEAAAAA